MRRNAVKKVVALLTGCLLLLLPFTAAADFTKNKVAVLDFQLQGEGFETQDMGSIVAEWFITALVKTGRFDVVERAMLKKILDEQKMGLTGVIDEQTATKLGRILGVKVIISGSVMKLQDIMEINARIIDVETASIIAAENVKATASTSLQSLIVQMSEKIIKNFPLEGYVVSRSGDEVTIDLGKLAGVKSEMEFMVFKEGKVIKHPKTGEVLDVERIETGTIKITAVNNKIATGEITEEDADNAIAISQMVKSISGPLTPLEVSTVYTGPGYQTTGGAPPRAKLTSADYIKKLQSRSIADKLWGAKKIIRDRVTDPAVFDVLEQEILVVYNDNPRDRNQSDAVSWMLKALGASGQAKYKETLNTVARNAKNRKVQGYAKKSMASL
jgi:TolB-like protein